MRQHHLDDERTSGLPRRLPLSTRPRMPLALAHRLLAGDACPTRTAAWYAKAQPTFSDTLALVRRFLWTQTDFRLSPSTEDLRQIPPALANHLADLLAYAA